MSLTSVFGMGTGGSSLQSSPEWYITAIADIFMVVKVIYFTFTIKKPRFSAKTDNCIDRKSWNTKDFYAR